MLVFLRSIPWPIAACIVTIVTLIVGWLVMLFVRKDVSHKPLEENKQIAITVMAFVSLAFTIIIGFAIYIGQSWYNNAEAASSLEANVLHKMLRDINEFMPEQAPPIQKTILDYVQYVLEDEWPRLRLEQDVSPKGYNQVTEIWKAYDNLEITTEKEQIWYKHALSNLNDFIAARDNRLEHNFSSIDPMFWTLLLTSGALTAVLVYFFWIKNILYDFTLTSINLIMVVLLLFLVFTIDRPFSGGLGITPYNFDLIMKDYGRKTNAIADLTDRSNVC